MVESDDSGSSYETDESEEESGQMLKPVFIPRESRLTIKEQGGCELLCLISHDNTI